MTTQRLFLVIFTSTFAFVYSCKPQPTSTASSVLKYLTLSQAGRWRPSDECISGVWRVYLSETDAGLPDHRPEPQQETSALCSHTARQQPSLLQRSLFCLFCVFLNIFRSQTISHKVVFVECFRRYISAFACAYLKCRELDARNFYQHTGDVQVKLQVESSK